jgi:DNA ligase-1
MADGIAVAAAVPAAAVRRAAMLSGDLRTTALAAFEEGEAGLARFRIELFRPLQPMLAQTADDVEAAMGHLGRATLEFKLDGARIQVHRQGDRVRVYTRHLREVTAAVPEVVEAALALPVDKMLLDGEVLALRPDGTPLPFQTTMRRFGRKLDIAAMRSELPLSPFFFDCLLLDGTELIDASQADRLAAIAGVAPQSQVVPWQATDDPASADAFLSAAVRAGHEGIMAKDPGATYAAGSRGRGWLKVKPVHTLDLVVLAVEWGSGRRKGWLSNLHLGARDPETGGFVMLGKTFKGLTDALLTWQTERFLALETHRDDWTVHVRPEQVVEVAFNEIQASPRYPAGMALRFARVKRYRSDKTAAEADTIDTVRAIHEGKRRPR